MSDIQKIIDDFLYSVQEYNKDNSATLTHIIDNLELIAKKSSTSEQLGLNNLALLLQDNLLCIYEDNQNLSLHQYELLKIWPQLFDNFVNQFEIDHTVTTVCTNLANDNWPIPVTGKDAEILQELLKTELDNQPVKENINQEELLSNTFTTLITTVEKIIDKNSLVLDGFTERIKKLTETAELSGFIGFHDLCLMALENISELQNYDQITDTQKTLITAWFSLAQKYLNNPESKQCCQALINNLSDTNWPLPIPDEDKSTLFDILGIDLQKNDDTEPTLKPGFLPKLSKLHNLLNAINDYPERFEEITENINNLIELSCSVNLLGLQDVFLFYQEGLEDFVKYKSRLDFNTIRFLSHFPKLISEYYHQPKNKAIASQLIQYLQHPNWDNSINIENAELLKSLLVNVNEDTGVHTFHGNLLSETIHNKAIANNHVISINGDENQFGIDKDLIEMLLGEINDSLTNKDSLIPSPTESPDLIEVKLNNYLLKNERFGNACQAAELTGLYECCSILNDALKQIIDKNIIYEVSHEQALSQWLINIASYLSDLNNIKTIQTLIQILNASIWKEPINQEQSALLIDLLHKPYILTSQAHSSGLLNEASPEDINIDISDDINIDLLEGLLQELPDQTSQLSEYIQNLSSDSPNTESLEKAQRVAHTIKGAANTVGIRGIAVLTHQLEEILQTLNSHKTFPNKPLANDLLLACDCLEDMSECLMQRQSAPEQSLTVLQYIYNWTNQIQQSGLETALMESKDTFDKAKVSEDIDAIQDVQPKQTKTANQGLTINLPMKTIDNLLRLMGESMILNLQLHEKIQYANTQSKTLKIKNTSIKDLCFELERQIELQGSTVNQQNAMNQSEVFDALELEQYSDLHTTSNRIVESSSDADEINTDIDNEIKSLNELLYTQSTIQSEIYDLMMQSRMLPFSKIVPRLERTIRQTCRALSKKVDLTVIGDNTLIDRNILTNITDPLMHMVRNAIDHGIETSAYRTENNKTEVGNIHIQVTREGTLIHIIFEDDGAGINKERIKTIASQRGILNNDHNYTDSELYDLIFQPGFSTRETSTQTSGRGIGMDIVKDQIMSMNGRISISSEIRKGTKFDIFLPISLITSHAIFTQHDNLTFALSNHNIIKILHPSEWIINNKNDTYLTLIDDEKADFYTIEYLLNTTNLNQIETQSERPALLVNYDNKHAVIFLHNISDNKNIVIKDTGAYLQKIQGVLGATISGNGNVVPVLDISELIRSINLTNTSTTLALAQTSLIQMLPLVMIVDDSISTRRALSQLMKDAGYDTITAKDGLEAIGLLENRLPSIILVDFEMPRMNGIELATHIRGTDSFQDIPMIMITSRATDKHKNSAFNAGINGYFVKPFSEDELVDQVAHFIDDHIPL